MARVFDALEDFRIELPSWGFANTGTRFGKFLQPAAAVTIEEKFSDAGQVHALTGVCPTLALHVLWDLPGGCRRRRGRAARAGATASGPARSTRTFSGSVYKFGSFGNPDAEVRAARSRTSTTASQSRAPQQPRRLAVVRRRLQLSRAPPTSGSAGWFVEGLQAVHAALARDQRLLVEYKPFEPAFYHTDIGDWGMALLLARAAGPQARVLVDTGHHYLSQNIEQIVAWLLAEDMLGGFHFNDRRYADDDLTLGSIDPYQVFRIFHEIRLFEHETGARADIAYMVDQSHNLKGKIEAMIQTVTMAQELYAKAALVDHGGWPGAGAPRSRAAESSCRTPSRPTCARRSATGGPARAPRDPLQAFRQGGYLEHITTSARARNAAAASSYA